MPILLYGLECLLLPKSDVNSSDYAVRRFLMKLYLRQLITMLYRIVAIS